MLEEDLVEEETVAWVEDTLTEVEDSVEEGMVACVEEDTAAGVEDTVLGMDQCRAPVDAVECMAPVVDVRDVWIVLEAEEWLGYLRRRGSGWRRTRTIGGE